jgi:hypothetical protein
MSWQTDADLSFVLDMINFYADIRQLFIFLYHQATIYYLNSSIRPPFKISRPISGQYLQEF